MRVLQLCHKPPYPPLDGGSIAINNISMGLVKQGVKLKVLTVSTHKHPFKPDETPKKWLKKTKAEGVYVDTKLNVVDAISSLITNDSYNISRFFSADFDIYLTRILQKKDYDVVLLESLFMTPYMATIRRFSNAKIVLRSHNLEFMIWKRLARASTKKVKAAYLHLLARQLKSYELSVIEQVDGIAAISPKDAAEYEKVLDDKTPVITIPFGLKTKNYPPQEKQYPNLNLFHLGAMDWMPNIEAIEWFLEKIWGKVNASYPDMTLNLGGRSSKKFKVNPKYKNINFLGEVPDAKEFMLEQDVMIVPLLSGGGMRIKIIEGMALGKTIISTTIGAEGIYCEHGKDILIADTPEEFFNCIKLLIEQPELKTTIGKNARLTIERDYDNKVLSKKLVEFFKTI